MRIPILLMGLYILVNGDISGLWAIPMASLGPIFFYSIAKTITWIFKGFKKDRDYF